MEIKPHPSTQQFTLYKTAVEENIKINNKNLVKLLQNVPVTLVG